MLILISLTAHIHTLVLHRELLEKLQHASHAASHLDFAPHAMHLLGRYGKCNVVFSKILLEEFQELCMEHGQMMMEYSSLTQVFFPTNKNSEIEERYWQGLAELFSKKRS